MCGWPAGLTYGPCGEDIQPPRKLDFSPDLPELCPTDRKSRYSGFNDERIRRMRLVLQLDQDIVGMVTGEHGYSRMTQLSEHDK